MPEPTATCGYCADDMATVLKYSTVRKSKLDLFLGPHLTLTQEAPVSCFRADRIHVRDQGQVSTEIIISAKHNFRISAVLQNIGHAGMYSTSSTRGSTPEILETVK